MNAVSKTAALALALGVFPAIATGQGGGGMVRTGVIGRDTMNIVRASPLSMVIMKTPARIDSMVKAMERMQIGSPEYLAAQDSLRVAFTRLTAEAGIARFQANGGTFVMRIDSPTAGRYTLTPVDVTPKGRLGFRADGASQSFMTETGQYIFYFQYPTVVEVEQDSPASRAGIRIGDSLLAFNGIDLRSAAINMTRLLTPGDDVSIRLRRDGDTKEYTLSVERASSSLEAARRTEWQMTVPPQAGLGDSVRTRRLLEERVAAGVVRAQGGGVGARAGGFGGSGAVTARPTITASYSGVLGAGMLDVDPDFAASINGMNGRRGVFVSTVPAGTPAARLGLKRGDVILRVENNDVSSMALLRLRMMQAENVDRLEKIRLTILRAGKTQELVYETGR